MRDARTINYASPPAGHYWRWNAAYDAIEWADGSTLALWQEVHAVLEELRESGIPPLGAVLLVIAACREENAVPFGERLEGFLEIMGTAIGPGEVASGITVKSSDFPDAATAFPAIRAEQRKIRDVLVNGFAAIQELPRDLRSSLAAKCLIASTVFTSCNFRLSSDNTSTVLDELAALGPRPLAGTTPRYGTRQRLTLDLQALLPGMARSSHQLESLLRTGLKDTRLAHVPLPEPVGAEVNSGSLLDTLHAAGAEAGIAAAVAKRAIAMMNFPGHIGTPRDLPVGGIADITNRGTIDKLLPHELAWDDLVLAARLVHNEALYFRREIPPLNVAVAHTILLDRELRLWGTGRVLSLGIALGLWHHPALKGPGGSFECVAATDRDFEHVELDSAAKVASALQTLVPTGSPDAFLQAWWDGARIVDDPALPDVSLILGKWHLEVETTRKLLGGIATWLHSRNGRFRILAIGREGDVEAHAWTPGGNRVLFRGEIDMEEILNGGLKPQTPATAPEPLRKPKEYGLSMFSPIYNADPLPFLLPEIPEATAYCPDHEAEPQSGGIGISTGKRLVKWPQLNWAGHDLCAAPPGTQYWAGKHHGLPIVIAAAEKVGGHVRVFRYENGGLEEIEMEASRHAFPRDAWVRGGAALLAYHSGAEALSLETGRRLHEISFEAGSVGPLWFDGAKIQVTPPLKDRQVRFTRGTWINADPGWPSMIVPDGAALRDGILQLSSGSEIYRFDPINLAWIGGSSRLGNFVPFQETSYSLSDRRPMRTAGISRKFDIWYDPRGFLILTNQKAVPPSAPKHWHIMLATKASSVWQPEYGLMAMAPRLRMPNTRPPALPPRTELQSYLSVKEYQSATA